MVAQFLFFKKLSYYSPQWLYQFTFPPTIQEGCVFSTSALTFIICRLFGVGCSEQYEVVPLYSFDLHFSSNQQCGASFHVLLSVCVCFLWRNVCLELLLIFFIVGFFLILKCMSCMYMEINPLSVRLFANIFINSVSCLSLPFPLLCKSF